MDRRFATAILAAFMLLVGVASATAQKSHGIAMHGDPALPADFQHFPYVNPDAPKGGRVECRCQVVDGQMNLVTVEMGRCTFLAPEIPMNGPEREVVGVPLQVDGETLLITAVSVGNPHCVIFTDRLDEAVVRRLGPRVEHHPAFPNRINVQWARVASRSQVDILIWERGAGWTLASGSSSSAVACAAVRNGLCDHGLVTVRMPGGELAIDVRSDWSVRLKGAVEEVYTGTLTPGFVATLHA